MCRMKLLMSVMVAIVIVFNAFAEAKKLTTNDVDSVFLEKSKIGGPPFWHQCETIGLRDTVIPQPEIRCYALDRLLDIRISTNTPRFIARIQADAEYIMSAETLFGMKLKDPELRKILRNVQRYQPLSTNDLETMRVRAFSLYEKKVSAKQILLY